MRGIQAGAYQRIYPNVFDPFHIVFMMSRRPWAALVSARASFLISILATGLEGDQLGSKCLAKFSVHTLSI